jgi:hypothetical protein
LVVPVVVVMMMDVSHDRYYQWSGFIALKVVIMLFRVTKDGYV